MKNQNSNHTDQDRDNPGDQGRRPSRSLEDLIDTSRMRGKGGASDKEDQTNTGGNDSDGYSEDAGEDEKDPSEKTGNEQ